jgi:hypothetical protein
MSQYEVAHVGRLHSIRGVVRVMISFAARSDYALMAG